MAKTKIALLGDIHGNLEALEAVLAKAAELEVTHYVCLGDIVGYGAEPSACLARVRSLHPVSCIMGNHDEYAAGDMPLSLFNRYAGIAIQWTRSRLSDEEKAWLRDLKYDDVVRIAGCEAFRIVHGTLDNPSLWGYIENRLQAITSMELQKPFRLCFCGHTHVPVMYEKHDWQIERKDFCEGSPYSLRPNHTYIVNIGSAGQPRDGNPLAAFTVYVPEDETVQLYRLEYDIKACQDKILQAGLPPCLAERLEAGR